MTILLTLLRSCPRGYEISEDPYKCLDVNECAKAPCEHECFNTPGSYYCACRPGFKPKPEYVPMLCCCCDFYYCYSYCYQH